MHAAAPRLVINREGVEAHRFTVRQGGHGHGRLVLAQLDADAHQLREGGRVAFRKTVVPEALDLDEDRFG